ncbi:hypothetical protein [Actinomyces sp. MRS3W]|uniref:hypothetical protein n=1 Tax=Actinomyces sp. MRS3W TaxID=2800796 RepID=UPI0028FDC277|nr:hypothetical protein [Actinomyces sp. MRS3W]MDU0348765.1 hypothetical protein [Actinomyces sp. MRS3W]
MSSLNPWRVIAALVIVAVSAGCSNTPNDQASTDSVVEATTEAATAPTASDAPDVAESLATDPEPAEDSELKAEETLDASADSSSEPGVLEPDQTEGRELTMADFFSVEGEDVSEDLYDVATLEGQKGVGSVLAWDEGVIELRLANRYKSLTFNAGQANTSRSSDNVLRVEIYKNGTSDDFVDIPFNEVHPFTVDVSNVNALKIVLKCRTRDDGSCDSDESITGVIYGVQLES